MSGIYFEKNANAKTSRRISMNKTKPTYNDDKRAKQLNKQFPPGTYTVVKAVNLRDGLAVDSERIRRLNKGEKVEVSEVICVKNITRARIVSPASGWTSMVSSKGIQCLALEARQVGEKTWDDIKKKAEDSGQGVVGMNTWNDLQNAKKASKLSAKHDKISNAVVKKRAVPGSGKTKACPECGTRFDACWGDCPNCNGELAQTWKEDAQDGAQAQPQRARQAPQQASQNTSKRMQRGAVNQPQVQINPTYQIMYQPVYQHMAQPTFQIDMSQQAPTLQHSQHTNLMFPAQQMYPAQAPPMQMYTHMQQPMQAPMQQPMHTPQQYVQTPMQSPTPQIQYMAHAQQAPANPALNPPRLVRGASLIQEAFQGMNQGMRQPAPDMAKLSVGDYVHELEAASPHGKAGDVSQKELPGLTYYPIPGQMPKRG